MNTLSGKVALVTGGGSGLGAAIALALAEAGAWVVVAGRRKDALGATAAKSKRITTFAADVTDENSVRLLFEHIADKIGELDIVVANAGAAASAPFHRIDFNAWLATLDVNLTGVFLTFKNALASMAKDREGRLIAIASTAGLKGYPYVAAYCAAKHGVIGLTKALALELARTSLTVNAICPGFAATPMLEQSLDTILAKTGKSLDEARAALSAINPQGRFVQPEEIAQTVLWLCGPHSAAVTGQAISVSGGEI